MNCILRFRIFLIVAAINFLITGCADTARTQQAQNTWNSINKIIPSDSNLRNLPKILNSSLANGSNVITNFASQSTAVFIPGTPEMPLVSGQEWYGNYGCGTSRQTITNRIETVGPKELSTDRILITSVIYFTYHRGRPNNGMRYTSGSYTTTGTYSPSNRLLILKPVKWIEQPPGFVPLGLIVNISSDGQIISGDIIESNPGCPTTVIMSNGNRIDAALPQAKSRSQLQRDLSDNAVLNEKARVAALTPEQREAEKKKNAERAAQWNAAAPLLLEMFVRMATTTKPREECDVNCRANEELRKDQAKEFEDRQERSYQSYPKY